MLCRPFLGRDTILCYQPPIFTTYYSCKGHYNGHIQRTEMSTRFIKFLSRTLSAIWKHFSVISIDLFPPPCDQVLSPGQEDNCLFHVFISSTHMVMNKIYFHVSQEKFIVITKSIVGRSHDMGYLSSTDQAWDTNPIAWDSTRSNKDTRFECGPTLWLPGPSDSIFLLLHIHTKWSVTVFRWLQHPVWRQIASWKVVICSEARQPASYTVTNYFHMTYSSSFSSKMWLRL